LALVAGEPTVDRCTLTRWRSCAALLQRWRSDTALSRHFSRRPSHCARISTTHLGQAIANRGDRRHTRLPYGAQCWEHVIEFAPFAVTSRLPSSGLALALPADYTQCVGPALTGQVYCSSGRPQWLVTHKGLLPGCSALERYIARLRSRVEERLWRALVLGIGGEQQTGLECLLAVPVGSRSSQLDQPRTGPVTVSGPSLVRALLRRARCANRASSYLGRAHPGNPCGGSGTLRWHHQGERRPALAESAPLGHAGCFCTAWMRQRRTTPLRYWKHSCASDEHVIGRKTHGGVIQVAGLTVQYYR